MTLSRNECPDQRGLRLQAIFDLVVSMVTRNECPDQRGLRPFNVTTYKYRMMGPGTNAPIRGD